MKQFKVGDWVRVNNKVHQIVEFINEDSCGKANMVELTDDYVHMDELVIWHPKEGEWCWFRTIHASNPVFGRFIKQINERYYADTHCSRSDYFKYCEPFIGELPSFIKENK
jgi:hypothetical protein